MLQDLDDPLSLPDSTREQRRAVIARGASLRRRRRALATGVPAAAAAVAASVVVALSFSPDPSGDGLLTAAAPPPELVFEEGVDKWTDSAHGACRDPVGDSAGEPDVTLFSLDRPRVPLVHYHWNPVPLRVSGVVELRFEATSIDGLRSRHLVARATGDGEAVEQFVRDPRTGARRDVPQRTEGPGRGGFAASFPEGALSGLGDRWTWVAFISVNGAVVDSCDPAQDSRNLSSGD